MRRRPVPGAKFGAISTLFSGRPVDGQASGDPNRDGNTLNDRTPGPGRNVFKGFGFNSHDFRITRKSPPPQGLANGWRCFPTGSFFSFRVCVSIHRVVRERLALLPLPRIGCESGAKVSAILRAAIVGVHLEP